MARRCGETPAAASLAFPRERRRQRTRIPRLCPICHFFLIHSQGQTTPVHPHSVSATGNLSTNEVDDGWSQLKPRPLEIISFNLPPCIWGKCCPERETSLAKVTQHIHYRVGPAAYITQLLCGLLILHRPARVHHEHHDRCHWPAAKGFAESPSAQTSPG